MLRAATICAVLAAVLTGCDKKPAPAPPTPPPTVTPKPTPPSTPTPTPKPPPTPEPTPYVPNKTLQVGSLFNGINYRVNLETIVGTTATAELATQDSYTVEVDVKVRVPKAHTNLAELRKLNDKIDKVLPGLALLLPTARVSPDFDDLYRAKVTAIRTSLNRLDGLLTRHNFYDCETILEMQHPQTKRRALLIQSDMDVDTDGADGDRIYTSDTTSRTFQPFTSYRWDKQTKYPNPCVAIWEKRISDNDTKLKELKGAEAQRLKSDNARLRLEVREMEKYSYLIGVVDPFVVLPTPMFGSLKEGPAVGDYCVVIVGDTLYPAIVGDAGPGMKVGEASLRICKQISPQSNGGNRPVNDLKATYLLFPGTAERPMVPPNYAQWRARCEVLLNEIGGWQGQLFDWPEITHSAVPPPPPPPTPPLPVGVAPVAPTPGAPGTTPAAPPAGGPGVAPAPSAVPAAPAGATVPAATPNAAPGTGSPQPAGVAPNGAKAPAVPAAPGAPKP